MLVYIFKFKYSYFWILITDILLYIMKYYKTDQSCFGCWSYNDIFQLKNNKQTA